MVDLKIRFVNMDRSLALEEYTREHIQALLRRLDGRPGNSKYIEVRYCIDARGAAGNTRDTECMITYKYPDLHDSIHVRKHAEDPHHALIEAIHATECVIQKATVKMQGGRRTVGKTNHSVESLKNPDFDDAEP